MNADKQETAEWTKMLFFFLPSRSRGETLAGESVQNIWFPHPRSKLGQHALSAWNALLVRSPDLIASFGVWLPCLVCCFLQPDISLPMWPYLFTSRMPFLMIANIIFMTFMCRKILFSCFIHTWVTWCLSPYCFQSLLFCSPRRFKVPCHAKFTLSMYS